MTKKQNQKPERSKEMKGNTDLEALRKMIENRNSRLENLRKAALPLAKVLAEAHRPEDTKYMVWWEWRGGTNRLLIWKIGDRNEAAEPEEWCLQKEVGEKVFVCSDGRIPRGPSRKELRDFCRWLAEPQTWEQYYQAEKEISDDEGELAEKLRRLAEVCLSR